MMKKLKQSVRKVNAMPTVLEFDPESRYAVDTPGTRINIGFLTHRSS